MSRSIKGTDGRLNQMTTTAMQVAETHMPTDTMEMPATSSLLSPRSHHCKKQRPSTTMGYLKNSWTFEIVAALLGGLSVVATVVVLQVYANGPLPSWSFGVTLNVFLGATTIITTIALGIPLSNGLSQLKWIRLAKYREGVPLASIERLEAASRGPWGCLMLIFSHPQW
jgi:hypothetical protein